MVVVPLPNPQLIFLGRTVLKSSPPFIPQAAYNLSINTTPFIQEIKYGRHKRTCTTSCWSPWHRSSSHWPCPAAAAESGGEGADKRALETVIKFYNAIKNKNIQELSSVVSDECRCVCNFFSFFQPLQGKQQVMEFLNYVINILGTNIEFVVDPTLHDGTGMDVGVSWRLECSKTHIPLGKGFSFYICHKYQGKVLIRNVEMFLEPVLHFEPIRLKLMGYVMSTMAKVSSFKLSKDELKKLALALSLMAVICTLCVILCLSK